MNRKLLTYALAFIVVLAAAVIIIVVLKPFNKQQPETVTLVTSRWSGPHADFQRTLLDRYEKKTGIKIIQDDISYNQLYNTQVVNMSNKTGEYDLVWVQESWLPEYVNAGYLRPLNQYFSQVSDFDLNSYKSVLVDINTYEGLVYGIPTMLQTPIVAYDKRRLEEAGLAPPDTWENMLSAARYFKAQGTGIAVPARKGLFDDNIWEAIMYSNDGGYFDENNKLNVNSSENIEALEFWQDLMATAIPGSLNWHVDEANKRLQFGYAPLGITISGLAGILEDPDQSQIAGNVGYGPVPYKKHPAARVSIWNWCIPADSKHPEEAFQLISWLTSEEIEKEQTLENSQLSAIVSLFDDEEIKNKLKFLPSILSSLDYPHSGPSHENAEALVDEMMEILFRVSVSDVEPADELNKLQEKMRPLFQ